MCISNKDSKNLTETDLDKSKTGKDVSLDSLKTNVFFGFYRFFRNALFGFSRDRGLLVFFLLHGTDRVFPVFVLDLSKKPM